MSRISRQTLREYLHDLLPQSASAEVERALRTDVSLREMLEEIRLEEDRGEHTIGAIWKREHITCPSREELGGYVLKGLSPERLSYIEFHLNTIECLFCQANVEDLMARRKSKKT